MHTIAAYFKRKNVSFAPDSRRDANFEILVFFTVCQRSTHFMCPDKKCIDAHKKCDGIDDCGDGSDEQIGVCPGEFFLFASNS